MKPRLIVILALVYLLWPADLIPDVLGILGRLDDLLVIGFVAWKMATQLRRPSPSGAHGGSTAQADPSAAEPLSPFAVFDLSSDASLNEIEDRYRELATLYHPDKVAHLGPDLQKTAHEKMVQIQDAYRKLKQARR